jgi:hypothetical protein
VSHQALGPQFDPYREPDIFEEAGLHPSLQGQWPEQAKGRMAQHIMARAGIRQTKRGVDAPHIVDWGSVGEYERGYPKGEVWTSQRHLHLPTLRHYMRGNVPEYDPDVDYDIKHGHHEGEREFYDPETYEHGGKTWLAEGHHRTIARRLGHG